jgi:ferrous iron transport protein A
MNDQSRSSHLSRNHEENGKLETPLSDLTIGKTGSVSRLEGDKEFMNQVACLGFTIGAQVTVLQNHGQGPLLVSLRGAHLALGRQEADLIQVELL